MPCTGGDQCGRAYLALAEDVEQHPGTGPGDRHEDQSTDGRRFPPHWRFLFAQPAALAAGCHQLMQPRRDGAEAFAQSPRERDWAVYGRGAVPALALRVSC